MPVAKLTADGHIVIPDEIKDLLGLLPGDSILFEPNGSHAVMSRLVPPRTAPSDIELRQSINRANLQTPIQYIKGVGPKLASILAKKGILTVEDALYLLPSRYEDRRELRRVADLRPGCTEVFHARLLSAGPASTRGGRKYYEAVAGDETGTIALKWFNFSPRYMKGVWQTGKVGVFTGEVIQYGLQREIHHPDVEWIDCGRDLADIMAADPLNFGRTVPLYPLCEGLHQKTMRKILREVVDGFAGCLDTHLPEGVMTRLGLLPLDRAIREVHFPGNSEDPRSLNDRSTTAHRSLAFDEFFFLQLGLAMKKRGRAIEEGIPFRVAHKYTRHLLKMLPFTLTDAQKRVLSEIKSDMSATSPMYRLVQGDVGSGKTIVSLIAALLAVENDYQVALMAPTEILAEQHYLNIHRYCDALGIRVCLVTSGLKGSAKSAVLEEVARGIIQIVVGTHAVIQDKVEFFRLGLGIIDEQHRFGVLQRGLLKKKGRNPDILVMTATPIPRTLAMSVFGDLSLSVIDELPPGRTPVATSICDESQRERVYRIIRDEIRKGRQAYVIYPLVEESDTSQLKAATRMAEHLARDVFPDLRIGLLHGRMKPEEKEAVMRSFKDRETDLLVSTTVIEVGIDVPNATVMVVEHAERFGLSQLHQLRGRVGRGGGRSRCLLLTGRNPTPDAGKRLRVMEQTSDGFAIAEADLEIRGPGDFLGTRQAGFPEFRVANIFRDASVLEQARKEAFSIVERDPCLSSPENAPMRWELLRRWEGRLELAGIA